MSYVDLDEYGEPRYKCHHCRDTQWMLVWCDGATCSRKRSAGHYPHMFAVRCACWLRLNAQSLALSASALRAKGDPVTADHLAAEDFTAGTYRWTNTVTL